MTLATLLTWLLSPVHREMNLKTVVNQRQSTVISPTRRASFTWADPLLFEKDIEAKRRWFDIQKIRDRYAKGKTIRMARLLVITPALVIFFPRLGIKDNSTENWSASKASRSFGCGDRQKQLEGGKLVALSKTALFCPLKLPQDPWSP